MSVVTQKVIIRGGIPRKGEVDGKAYDSTEFYIEESIDPDSGGGGFATTPMKFGKSDNYPIVMSQAKGFPFQAEIDIISVTNGRGGSKRSITAVRPIPPKA